MAVSSVTAANLAPPPTVQRVKRTSKGPRQVITAPPFSAAAQQQANALNTGRYPVRGKLINIVA